MSAFLSKFNYLLALQELLELLPQQPGPGMAPVGNSNLILEKGERQNISAAPLFHTSARENIFSPGYLPPAPTPNRTRGQYNRVAEQGRSLWNIVESAVQTLMVLIEKSDAKTAGHQHRVAGLAASIAQAMAFPPDRITNIFLAATLHDIGKIYIPEIITKAGPLSQTELSLVKKHPRAGFDIVKHIPLPRCIPIAILQHHERLDGSGYPDGLMSGEILMEARIVAVADVVEAMTSNRPYRSALGINVVLQELGEHQGTLYDPEVVKAFRQCLHKKKWSPAT